MQLNIYDSVDEVLQSMAEYFVQAAQVAISKKGHFSVALSGGTSPKKLFALLASGAFKNKVDWHRIVFFFGDERYVPHTDAASNFKMVDEVLFKPLNIPGANIFPVDTSLTPVDAANDYWNKITAYFKDDSPRFDLILLGLGNDAHTASLFPHTPVLQEKLPSVKSVFLNDQQVFRITLTAPLINMAHKIAFLVYGSEKAEAVHHVLKGAKDVQQYPAQIIAPADGTLEWFLDKAAAVNLPLQNG